MNTIIKATNFALVPSVEEAIIKKLIPLKKFLPPGTEPLELRVEVALDTKHHQKGAIYRAEANFRAHSDIIRAEAFGKDIFAAMASVKKILAREIKQYKCRQATQQRKGMEKNKRK